MREDSGRWVAFGVLVLLLVGILLSHFKKQEEVAKPSPFKEIERAQPVRTVDDFKEKTQPLEIDGFYPSDPQVLKRTLSGLLKIAQKKKVSGKLVGLITPHASAEYSGEIAAQAFKQLEGLSFDTVVLLIPNHEGASVNGIVVCPKGKWATPFGVVEVDKELAKALGKESSQFDFAVDPFNKEHALTVQLPFLQETLGSFKVLPILIEGRSAEKALRLADALKRVSKGKKVLFIATSHFSRGQEYSKAKRLDFLATSAIEQMDLDKLREYDQEDLIQMCGYTPVFTLLTLLKEEGVQKAELLKVANSADVTGNKDEAIVGYAAIGFYK